VPVTLLYFAWVREAIGVGAEDVDVPPECHTARELAMWLAKRGEGYERAFGDMAKLRCAVDQTIVTLDQPLSSAHEIAFFPPVTGG
jgi:sulfur-carrier protein